MKCFSFIKEKHKTRRGPSAHNLSERPSTSDLPERAVKSSGSVPSSSRSVPELYRENEHNLRSFSYSELKEATNGFDRMLKIGEGGFGSVYKGSIRPVDGEGYPIVVAIKKLNSDSMQGHKQWFAEVQFLSIVNHPNLVRLLGYCCVNGERGIQRLLVYEFMPNRSLENHLFSKISPPMPWMRRLHIILDAAHGLAYLHEGMEVQVIFRDFKCSNVLLSEDFKAKLSDFGLAREGPTGDKTHVSTGIVGTEGYAAPEYVETGHLTLKSDIWSFGVVLYEILTGRRVLERNRPTVEQKLLDWVKSYPADSKKFNTIIDPRLRNQYCLVAARKIAKMADKCLNKDAKDRPTMSQVVECLKEAIRDSEAETLSRTGS